MTDITLTGEGTQYTPDQEFKVSWTGGEGGSSVASEAGEVKLKALIPPWTREFITTGGTKQNNNTRKSDEEEGSRAKRIVEQLEEEESERVA